MQRRDFFRTVRVMTRAVSAAAIVTLLVAGCADDEDVGVDKFLSAAPSETEKPAPQGADYGEPAALDRGADNGGGAGVGLHGSDSVITEPIVIVDPVIPNVVTSEPTVPVTPPPPSPWEVSESDTYCYYGFGKYVPIERSGPCNESDGGVVVSGRDAVFVEPTVPSVPQPTTPWDVSESDTYCYYGFGKYVPIERSGPCNEFSGNGVVVSGKDEAAGAYCDFGAYTADGKGGCSFAPSGVCAAGGAEVTMDECVARQQTAPRPALPEKY